MDKEEILGRGWGFPPSFDKSSNEAAMISGEEDVESSIYVIIHTKFGERVMRNEFGSNIYDLLFEPLNENMKTFMASTLKDSLIDNEPRINIEKITLTQNDPALGKVDIKVEFTMIETNVTKNLVVPFYVPDNI
jgi:phage baseplate assembly protein W